MKVVVIGGGSTYTPELVNGFLERIETFPLSELCLMDDNKPRLDIVGGFAKRIVKAKERPFRVILTTDLRKAINGASYIITQLRVGLMDARKNDEYLGKRHGLIGQETTGVGGMAKALRTIPVILNIANIMSELAPNALLVNFTNPAGLITEALSRYTPDIQAVGVCNVPITAKMMMLENIEKKMQTSISPEQAELNTLGLNHLSWHRGFKVDGNDLWPEIMEEYVDGLKSSENPEWDMSLIENLQMIPNYYLEYFYSTDHKLENQNTWPPSRAEEVIEVEKELLAQYADIDRSTPPEDLLKRGGAYYSTLATQLLNAHYNEVEETHIVNTPHKGAVSEWPEDWVLEMPSKIGNKKIEPLPAEPLPLVCFGLIAQVKSYELLIVKAAVHGDRDAAYQALLAHPLGPSADQVQIVLDDMLETNKKYLPQFWK